MTFLPMVSGGPIMIGDVKNDWSRCTVRNVIKIVDYMLSVKPIVNLVVGEL